MNTWVLYAIGAGLFVLIVLGLVWLLRRRSARHPREPDPTYAWGEPATIPDTAAAQPRMAPAAEFHADPPTRAPPPPLARAPTPAQPARVPAEPPALMGPVHMCKCPNCQTQFSVTGAKPIVTNCPGCGKKGYLR